MELRVAEGARATEDIDISLTGAPAERLRAFGIALALGFDEFTFQLKGKPLHMPLITEAHAGFLVRIREGTLAILFNPNPRPLRVGTLSKVPGMIKSP
jgi:hypothetical protein